MALQAVAHEKWFMFRRREEVGMRGRGVTGGVVKKGGRRGVAPVGQSKQGTGGPLYSGRAITLASSSFIHHPAFGGGHVAEAGKKFLLPLKLVGMEDENIQGKSPLWKQTPDRAVPLPAVAGHVGHDEQVDVAIKRGIATPMGAEKVNPVRVHLLDDFFDNRVDDLVCGHEQHLSDDIPAVCQPKPGALAEVPGRVRITLIYRVSGGGKRDIY